MWLRNQRKDKKIEEYCLKNFEKLNESNISLNNAKDRNWKENVFNHGTGFLNEI